MSKWTAEVIRERVASDDRWLVRGLLALYARQTEDERKAQQTRHHNRAGFNGADSPILSSFAEQVLAWQRGESRYRDPLSPRQKALARRKLAKYAGQLATIANERVQH